MAKSKGNEFITYLPLTTVESESSEIPGIVHDADTSSSRVIETQESLEGRRQGLCWYQFDLSATVARLPMCAWETPLS